MKRLITTAIITLVSLVVLTVPAYAVLQRYVNVDISEPAATSNRTLNIAYGVTSTIPEDDFKVELFENSLSKGTQEVTHNNGNSGVFSISLPATGTYSYYVQSTNHGDGESTKPSKTVSVQITNAPQPTVTTVFTNTGAGGQGAGTAGTATGGQTAGAVAGDTNGDGVVDDQAASTDKDKKDVLGAETKKTDDGSKTSNWWYAGGLAALLAAGYYYLVVRRANQN